MKTAKQVIEGKAHYNNVVGPHEKVLNAVKIMKKEDISYTIVMDEEKYLGIFGEKEYSQSVVLNGNHADEMLVKELLGTVYPAIDASDTTDNCIKLMSCYKLRYLPVFDGFDFIGIVTENDLLDEVAKEKTVK